MPETPAQPPPPSAQEKASGLAIASMVLGIIGLFLFGLILGPLAIIFGWMEKKNIAEGKSSRAGYGYAQAGFVLGIIDTAIYWLCCLSYLAFLFFSVMLSSVQK